MKPPLTEQGNASSSEALSLLIMQRFNLSRFNETIYPLFLLFVLFLWELVVMTFVISVNHTLTV